MAVKIEKSKVKVEKPRLGFWQIWNMNFGFLGIQFGFALQNGNTSRIFETLGAKIDEIAILWIAAPVTGLIVQPIIGYLSDKTWHPVYGRRRPFFALGAVLASLALFVMPHSSALWMAAGMLWILDASINISMEPFRAFVGDMLPEKQRTIGFAMQTFFIGVGAVVGNFLPYILANYLGIANTASKGEIPANVIISFYIGGLVFVSSVLWTVFKTKEYPPKMFEESQEIDNELDEDLKRRKFFEKRFIFIGSFLILLGIIFSLIVYSQTLDKQLYVLGVGLAVFGISHLIAGIMISIGKYKNGLVNIIKDFNQMPTTMMQLAFVQFFSWLALFAMWIYSTPAIASHIFGSADPTSKLYNEGADWVNVMFGTYNGLSALFAFLFPPFAMATSRKTAHMVGLICGGIGLISIYFFTDKYMLLFSMAGVGFAWASILSMPYAILASALPANKMGIYMGIFNFFVVIPQIVAASILGTVLMRLFNGQAIYAMIVGGVSMLIAAVLVIWVKDEGDKKVI